MGQAGPHSLWYASRDGLQSGPFLMHELQDRFQSGAIADHDLVWCAEENDWRPAADVLANYAAPSNSALAPRRENHRPTAPKGKIAKVSFGAGGASEMTPEIAMPQTVTLAQSTPFAPAARLPEALPAAVTRAGSIKGAAIVLFLLGIFLPVLLPVFWWLAWRSFRAGATAASQRQG